MNKVILLNKDVPIDEVEQEYKDLLFDIEYDKEKFKDPATIGLLLYRLAKERERTNQLFKQIIEKLEEIKKLNANTQPTSTLEISDTDKQLLEFVKLQGTVDAELVKKQFGYKGKNAASARLNALYKLGLLQKARSGKKVRYWVQQS